MNPAGFSNSGAIGVGGGQQVGYVTATFASPTRAFLWSGTAASGVNLHPAGFDISMARDTDGTRQVGTATIISTTTHAALWEGTASSFVDLHALLPPGFTDSSADYINGDTIYGIARSVTGESHVVAWSLVPEPATAGLFLAAACVVSRRRFRQYA